MAGLRELGIKPADALAAEEISNAARRHTLDEINAAIADAKATGAARWAWVARRLDDGRR